MAKKKLKGTIISNKMKKTVVVRVEEMKQHPKYRRRFKAHKNYKAHDEKEEYRIGDKVIIEECRPISKEKKWKVIEAITIGSREEIEESPEISSEEENIK